MSLARRLLMGSNAIPKTKTFIGRQSQTNNTSSRNFTVDFGAVEGVGVLVIGARDNAVTAVSFGGIGGAGQIAGVSGSVRTSIWSAEGISGSMTVSITFAGSTGQCALDAYLLTGVTATAYDTDQNAASSSSVSTSLDVPSDGIVIAGATSAGNRNFTWSGATEDADASVESRGYSAASESGLSTQAGRTVGVTQSSGSDACVVVAASW